MMLLITGSARPIQGAREQMITAIREITAATQSDPGCLHYTFAGSLDDDAIMSVELWENRAALEAHMEHDHTRRFLRDLNGLLDGTPVMQETEL
jgi:quinol monooxygenase YgiN